LAGLLYLGAGLGLLAAGLVRKRSSAGREAKVRRADFAPLLGIVILGGVVGPTLMLVGLQRVSGVTGSLALNLEAPFTILLAVLVFKEHIGLHDTLAAALIVAGALVLAYSPGDLSGDWTGLLAIALACLSWAIDNNLTQRLSLRDPLSSCESKRSGRVSVRLALL
jgi:drug/metabolite transporter (DMT)-like permease